MTNAELAILSLLVERPRHGYEIEQVIEERGMREWTEVGFSSIYYLLKKLEQAGLIAGRLADAERGPARRVYEATPAGREALHAGVLEALSVPRRCYPPLQLGLANLPGLPPREAVAALSRYRAALAERLALVQGNWLSKGTLPYFVEAMFDYSVTMVEAEMEWVERFMTRLTKLEEGEQER
jgi:DNA-binding PadR family transcriptional regulator